MNEYITPRQAAELKGVSVPTIYKAIERGLLHSVRVLDRVALRVSDVDAYKPGSYGGVKRTIIRRGQGEALSRPMLSLNRNQTTNKTYNVKIQSF